MEARVWSGLLLVSLALVSLLSVTPAKADEVEKVLTLDHSNFSDIVSKHSFIVVEFYAPWYVSICSVLTDLFFFF